MKRYSTIMSVLLTLALPVAGTCANAPTAPEKADASVEALNNSMSNGGHSPMTGLTGGQAPAQVDLNPTGKVLETMDGGGYTYANLEGKGTKTWVAYPVLATKVGDTLSFRGCLPMSNFPSRALNRTFDSILFCGAPTVAGQQAQAKPAASPAGKTAAVVANVKVDKATGANAYTIEELYAKSGTLDGKQIVVKGQVVKVSAGIMNRNWLHLQDGSGDANNKTNDLTVTSEQTAKVGDVVTVSGTLAKDKDFGGGYKYATIIEKGSISK